MSAVLPWCSPECGISGTRIILGIDPGLRKTGFGVIAIEQGKARYLASGAISTASAGTDLPPRLGVIFEGVSQIIEQFRPTEAAIEKVFVNVNPQSTLLLGQARGAAIVALTRAGLSVAEYTALQLKQAVVGYGHATKQQIQAMVKRLLTLAGEPSTDAADALACAICHWNTTSSNLLIAKKR